MIDPAWQGLQQIQPNSFRCGHCGRETGNDRGYQAARKEGWHIYICPPCGKPTFISPGKQVPGPPYGNPIDHLPTDVEALYNEARECMTVAAHTSAILTCRKILMNVAVAKGAEHGISFIHYVEFLADKGYIPPNARGWVDHIRLRGNEANHEIKIMKREDAESLLSLTEMLLKIVFEMPGQIPGAALAQQGEGERGAQDGEAPP